MCWLVCWWFYVCLKIWSNIYCCFCFYWFWPGMPGSGVAWAEEHILRNLLGYVGRIASNLICQAVKKAWSDLALIQYTALARYKRIGQADNAVKIGNCRGKIEKIFIETCKDTAAELSERLTWFPHCPSWRVITDINSHKLVELCSIPSSHSLKNLSRSSSSGYQMNWSYAPTSDVPYIL